MLETVSFLLKHTRKQQWHAAVIIIGMTVAVAFSVGITTIVSAVNADFNETKRGPSHVDITVNARNGTRFDGTAIETRLQQVDGIDIISPVLQQTYNSANFTTKNLNFTIRVLGIDPKTHPDFSRIKLLAGSANITHQQIIVSQALLTKLSIKEGTSFMALGWKFTVSGIFDNAQQRIFGTLDVTNLIIMNVDYLREILGLEEGIYDAMHVKIKNIVDVEQVRDQMALLLGDEFDVVQQVSITSLDKLAISSYGTTMAIIILITIFVEFIFLLNLFLIIINERQRTFGLLRAIGLSKTKLVLSFLIEIFVLGTLATLLGLLIGHVMATSLLKYLLSTQGLTLIHPITLQPPDIIFAFGVGLGVGFIASLYPTFTLLRLNIALTLSERRMLFSEIKTSIPSAQLFLIVTALFTVMAAFLTYQSSQNKILEIQLESGPALMSIGMILFLLLITTVLSLACIQGLNMLIKRSSRLVTFFIAMRNILRYRIRSMTSILTNGLAFAFALVIIILSASLAASVPSWFEDSYPNVDMIVKIDHKTPLYRDNVSSLARAHANIKKVIFIQTIKTRAVELNEVFDINGINASEFDKYGPRILQGRGYASLLSTNDTPTSNSVQPALITESIAKLHQVSINDTLKIRSIGSSIEFNILVTGIVSDTIFSPTTNKFQVFMHHQNLEQALNTKDVPLNYLLIILKDKRIVEEVRITLMEQFPEIEKIITIQENLEILRTAINRQKTLLQALSIQAFLIAIVTQFISIILSTENSRREIGILRSMGLSSHGSFTLFFLEGLTLTIAGILSGIINGMSGSLIIAWYIEQVARTLPLQFNLLELGGWILVYLLLAAAVVMYPASKMTELTPIDALDERPRTLTSKKPDFASIRTLSLQDFIIISFWAFLYLTGVVILPVALELIPIPTSFKEVFQILLMLASITFLGIGGSYLMKKHVSSMKTQLVAYQKFYSVEDLGGSVLDISQKQPKKTTTPSLSTIKFPSNLFIPWHVKLRVILNALFIKGTIRISHVIELYRFQIKTLIHYLLVFLTTGLLLILMHILDDPITFMISMSSESTYLTMLLPMLLLGVIGILVISTFTVIFLRLAWSLEPDIHPFMHYLVKIHEEQLFKVTIKLFFILLARFITRTFFDAFLSPTYATLFLDCIFTYLYYQVTMAYFRGSYEGLLADSGTTSPFSAWKTKEALTTKGR